MNPSDFQTIHLSDYQAPLFAIHSLFLSVTLSETCTIVTATMHLSRQKEAHSDLPLILDGEQMQLLEVHLNGTRLDSTAYEVTSEQLIIKKVPDSFELIIKTEIHPESNTSLTGLYRSDDMYCTQCEAHGFRRITYFIDRPDVMTIFTTKITADKTKYPILLSNGNLIESGDLDDNQHFVVWQDPYKKPAYLFALVAGDLDCLTDSFITQSQRKVSLQLYVEKGQLSSCPFAMEALKKAMKWDEENYGREYDLDIYMIVAVSHFNMGAMENKGLNIFNDKYILSHPELTTDQDFFNIERVIGHEYFHNWTGNRITLRDWFQLSLKEGLTVYREQSFCSDIISKDETRIAQVEQLRALQFPEDAGPMAHPIRPKQYIEVNNFYTPTVYNKGAEVIRMMACVLGETGFRKGMDCYFERHDGQAVTLEQFIEALEAPNAVSLQKFLNWYNQAGTPFLSVHTDYDPIAKTFKITFTQSPPSNADSDYLPVPIPIAFALFDQSGELMKLTQDNQQHATEQIVLLTEKTKQLHFSAVPEKPILSVLRDFSAPVKLNYDISLEELAFLIQHEQNGFARFEAAHTLATRLILGSSKSILHSQPTVMNTTVIETYRALLEDKQIDDALLAKLLSLPSMPFLMEQIQEVNIAALEASRTHYAQSLNTALFDLFYARLMHLIKETEPHYEFTQQAISRRSLKNQLLNLLSKSETPAIFDLAFDLYQKADNMTDRVGTLQVLTHATSSVRDKAFSDFYTKWHAHHLAVDKWFSLQALSQRVDAFSLVENLTQHPDFSYTNPNRLRALVGTFSQQNVQRFHDVNGKPYAFLTDMIIQLNQSNPQVAARLVTPLIHWKKFADPYKTALKQQLERLSTTPHLSKDVAEPVIKALEK